MLDTAVLSVEFGQSYSELPVKLEPVLSGLSRKNAKAKEEKEKTQKAS
jgi:hypothetical protein